MQGLTARRILIKGKPSFSPIGFCVMDRAHQVHCLPFNEGLSIRPLLLGFIDK